MTPRRPRSATTSTALPSLAVGSSLLAAGCAEPVCGGTRAAELSAHARTMRNAAEQGRGGDALREFAVATGLRAHPIAPEPSMHTAGEPMIVEPVPQVPPPPPVPVPESPTRGERMPVSHGDPPSPSRLRDPLR